MATLNWTPLAKTTHESSHSSPQANDTWFGVALGLMGLIVGYGIAILHIV